MPFEDAEELETVRDELESVRGKIHKSLVEEDHLLNELSKLAKDHFPGIYLFIMLHY